MLVVEVLVVAAVLFAVAVAATGRGGELQPVRPDRIAPELPTDRPMHADDVAALRFPLAFRGYRMADVDRALDRVASALRGRDAQIAVLQAELDAARHGEA